MKFDSTSYILRVLNEQGWDLNNSKHRSELRSHFKGNFEILSLINTAEFLNCVPKHKRPKQFSNVQVKGNTIIYNDWV